MKNYYQTLGIAEGASQEEIQVAYDSLCNELDPKKNQNQEFFLEEFEKLQEAYKVLRNSSILAVTSQTTEDSTSVEVSPISKTSNTKLKPQKERSQSKVKKTKIIIVASAIIISTLITYVLFQSNQYEPSQITLINDDVLSAFTRVDMKPLNGYVKGVGTFINGLAEGEHKKLDKNGNIQLLANFKNGNKVGLWKEWYPIKDGKWHFWYEKGILKSECNYKNGFLVGDYNSWYPNGQLKIKGRFENGIEKGNWYYYDIKGKILAHFNLDKTIWAEKNLDVTRYRNGDLIPEVKDTKEWFSLTTGAWCYFNNDPKNEKLYNWYAVNDPRGLSPEGYHIPSQIEINFLMNLVSVKDGVSKKWKYLVTNEGAWRFQGIDFYRLKLNPIPTGSRTSYHNLNWVYSNDNYSFWTSSSYSHRLTEADVLKFNLDDNKIQKAYAEKRQGIPVMCIKN